MTCGRPASRAASLLLRGLVLLRLTLPVRSLRVDARQGPGGTVMPLNSAVSELVKMGSPGDFCLSIPGPFMGRISNTVAMMNVVLRLAVESGASFRFPRYYTDYMQWEGFGNLFGPGEETCDPHEVETYDLTCPPPKGPTCFACKGRCTTNEFLLDKAKPRTISTDLLCNCKRAVVVNGSELMWNHDFCKTHDLLRQRYWQAHPQPLVLPREPGSSSGSSSSSSSSSELMGGNAPKPRLVVHVRLGDVEDLERCLKRFTIFNCRKKLQVDIYEHVMKAITTVLPASCVDINLVTDGKLHSPDIVRLQRNLTVDGQAPKVWTADMLSTAKTFELMTHADVLVFGSSGFGQVAGILARPEAARIGSPMPPGHSPNPLGCLPNSTQLFHPKEFSMERSSEVLDTNEILDMSKAIQSLAANKALQALAASCGAARA